MIPAVRSPTAAHANHSISLVIILQYIPRLFVIFPLNQRITKTTGVIAKTAWAGAAYYIMLYMLASHVSNQTPIYGCNKKKKKKDENPYVVLVYIYKYIMYYYLI